jgi:hypothetical protein
LFKYHIYRFGSAKPCHIIARSWSKHRYLVWQKTCIQGWRGMSFPTQLIQRVTWQCYATRMAPSQGKVTPLVLHMGENYFSWLNNPISWLTFLWDFVTSCVKVIQLYEWSFSFCLS